MPFDLCTTVFGKADIIAERPDVEKGIDCIYRPFASGVFFDRDPSWGLYDHDGRIVPLGSYRRGESLDLVGQSERLNAGFHALEINDEPHVYFGPLIPHYGHFLITSLARAWFATTSEASNLKLLCHSDHEVSDHFSGSYMGVLVGALGLSSDRFTRPLVPTRFTNLTVPGPAFVEQHLAHSAFLNPMHKIGKTLSENKRQARTGRTVYVSKSRMPLHSVAHVTNEAELENKLVGHGVEVVHPEILSLEEQVEVFMTSSKIIGFAGSGFHTHLLLENPPEMICLTFDHFINSNFIITDLLNSARANYFHSADNLEFTDIPGYGVSRTIGSIDKFSKDLFDAAGIAHKHCLVPGRTLERQASMKSNDGKNLLTNCSEDDRSNVLTESCSKSKPARDTASNHKLYDKPSTCGKAAGWENISMKAESIIVGAVGTAVDHLIRSETQIRAGQHFLHHACGATHRLDALHERLADDTSKRLLEWIISHRTITALTSREIAERLCPPRLSDFQWDKLLHRARTIPEADLEENLPVDVVENYILDGYNLPGICEVSPGDTVLDLGAFNGNSSIVLGRKATAGGRVYAFEPNPDTQAVFRRNISRTELMNIELLPMGVSSESGNLRFARGGAASRIDPRGDVVVEVTTVDKFVSNRGLSSIDFIKFDIEGFELDALAGAVDTIRRFRPKIAISVYHLHYDVLDIPQKILDLSSWYKIYMRHNANYDGEIVLYCVED